MTGVSTVTFEPDDETKALLDRLPAEAGVVDLSGPFREFFGGDGDVLGTEVK
jgi:hypothetical protein